MTETTLSGILLSTGRILVGFVRSLNLQRKSDGSLRRESWNAGMYFIVAFMRSFVISHSRDLLTLRAVTDFALIPTIPRGAYWKRVKFSGVDSEVAWPRSLGRRFPLDPDHRVVLYLHGGGGALCSSMTHRWITHGIAVRSGAVVVVPNYRRVPEASLMHSLEDSLEVYKSVLTIVDAKNILIAGDSAGGALTIAALCKIRDLGLPMPAGGALLSPWCDITEVPGVTDNVDYLTADIVAFMIELLRGEHGDEQTLSSMNPMQVDLSDLPPLLIQLGDSELFADQIRRFSKRCQNTEIHEYHEMVHIPHFFSVLSSEGDRALDDLGRFMKGRVPLN